MAVNSVDHCYNFFFHPMSEHHSPLVALMSLVTNVALTILTGGIYLALFAIMQIKDCFRVTKLPKKRNIDTPFGNMKGFVGIQALKEKQANHLNKLQKLAQQGQWQHLREHTAHPSSGFDWWMFPIDRSSTSYGDRYKLSADDIRLLMKDPEFMDNYRAGVKLILLSWGWDATTNQNVSNESQKWVGYQVRLGKMAQSLALFEEKELLESLRAFCISAKIYDSLENWIKGTIFS